MSKTVKGYVLVTGVSTGIGYAATADLAAAGYHVFGSVRRQADAERLQREIPTNFTPLLFDVTDEVAVETAVATIAHTVKGQGLTALINNAGIAIAGPLQHIALDDFRRQFDANLLPKMYANICTHSSPAI
jgi:NAD(P)-dependent dehydrogenase (short-subunit alcohol dehydrogenase family)